MVKEQLIIPCEVAAKSVIPAIKALIATELVEKHALRQDKVAEILGISQSAVSKYARKVRGYVIKIDNMEEIEPLIGKMVDSLLSGTYQRKELLKTFCQTCISIRKMRLMCQFCRKSEPQLKIEECGFCLSYDSQRKE